MLKCHKRSGVRGGFTLLELMVVIGIIALLISILVPGMQHVKRIARSIEQKSMFRNIEIGLELFAEEYGGYPDSDVISDDASNQNVCGAQHLAEMLVGRDQRGFDPKSNWHDPDEPEDIYASDEATPEGQNSIARREEPYIRLRKTGVYLLDQLYDVSAPDFDADLLTGEQDFGTGGTKRAPVLTDVFETRISVTDSLVNRAGTPIVYYRADSASKLYKKVPAAGDDKDVTKNWIYDWYDNEEIFNLPPLMQTSKYPEHLYKGTAGKILFYEKITNLTVSYDQPYNSKTFILISAGRDSVFGTKDDITNFD